MMQEYFRELLYTPYLDSTNVNGLLHTLIHMVTHTHKLACYYHYCFSILSFGIICELVANFMTFPPK